MDVSQYLEIFIDETKEHLQSLSDNLMVLEKEPENKDTINEIFRAAHSMKGMAGTMGYKRMQKLTHVMEDVFSEVRSDNVKVTPDLVDVLFECLTAIETYLDNIIKSADEGDNDNEELITSLKATLDGTEQKKNQRRKHKHHSLRMTSVNISISSMQNLSSMRSRKQLLTSRMYLLLRYMYKRVVC